MNDDIQKLIAAASRLCRRPIYVTVDPLLAHRATYHPHKHWLRVRSGDLGWIRYGLVIAVYAANCWLGRGPVHGWVSVANAPQGQTNTLLTAQAALNREFERHA